MSLPKPRLRRWKARRTGTYYDHVVCRSHKLLAKDRAKSRAYYYSPKAVAHRKTAAYRAERHDVYVRQRARGTR